MGYVDAEKVKLLQECLPCPFPPIQRSLENGEVQNNIAGVVGVGAVARTVTRARVGAFKMDFDRRRRLIGYRSVDLWPKV